MIKLTKRQREDLEAIVGRRSNPAGMVRRARVILLTAAGESGVTIAEKLDLSMVSVSRIRRRFIDGGVEAVAERPKTGRKDHAVAPEVEKQIVELAMSPPPAGRSRWTTRLIGKQLGLTSGCISDILRRNGMKPHLVRTYKVSRDPEFAAKVKDVVGLYLNPPEHAVVLSVDEKTSIQALQRTQPPLPLRSGRAVRHTHDYKRHGVVDLFAALEVATGKVTHRVSDTHTGADFLAFMKKVVRQYPGRELHVFLDNSSTHGTEDIQAWLTNNPQVHFHYTPTSASWLNEVEGFFGILAKQSLSLTDFPSKRALRDHLNAYMRQWNRSPTPFEWTKPANAIIQSHRKMLNRLSTAVH
ncbi:IS630 family transposase [Candidatus Binatia bacterium]|nr:IS630 family transposase [Candidatus Binatia bacterium]